MRDIEQIISELEAQRRAIDNAISALRGVTTSGSGRSTSTKVSESARATTKRRRLSPEGRRRIAEAARQRWAAQKAGQSRSTEAGTAKKQGAKRTRRKRSGTKTVATTAS
jgi:hypothetical protein